MRIRPFMFHSLAQTGHERVGQWIFYAEHGTLAARHSARDAGRRTNRPPPAAKGDRLEKSWLAAVSARALVGGSVVAGAEVATFRLTASCV